MDTVCASCGAPVRPGVIECEFCERPVSAEAAKNAIPCKQCRTLNAETAQQCIKCKAWVVVQCVFCNHLTRNDAAACLSCREPFMGAAERKAARDAQLRNQQYMNVAVAAAPLAGSLIGGLAGALLGGSSSHHHSPPSHRGSVGDAVFGDDSSSSAGESLRQSYSDDSGSVVDSIADAFSDDDDNNRG